MNAKQQIEEIESRLYYIREDMDSDSTEQTDEQLDAAQEVLSALAEGLDSLIAALFT